MTLSRDYLLARYGEVARNIASRVLSSRAEADAVVEAAAADLERAQRDDPERFRASRRARDEFLADVLRRAKVPLPSPESPSSQPEPEAEADETLSPEEADWQERLAALDRAVHELEPASFELFDLRFRRRWMLLRIAAESGAPLAIVELRAQELLRALRRAVASREASE